MPDVWWTYNNISSRSTPTNRHEQSLAFPFLWLIFLTPSPYIYWKPTPFPPPSLTPSLTFVFPAPRTFQTLSPTDTLPSLSDTINYISHSRSQTHTCTHKHTRVHTLVCVLLLSDFPMRRFWGLVLERLVFLSENFKLSNCRKQKKKKQQLQTRKSKQWVSERRALLCFFIYVLLSLTWWS